MKNWLRIVSLTLVLASCGKPSTDGQLSSLENPTVRDLTLFFSGGYNSCGDPEFPNVIGNILREYRASGVQLRYVAGCFDKSGTLYTRSSTNPHRDREMSPQQAGLELRSEILKTQSKSLVAIGHSYGGWLAMTVSESSADIAHIKSLITIDPISPNHCYPSIVAAALLGELATGVNMQSRGCSTFPQDWPRSRAQLLRTHTNDWFNFYQDRDDVVHSGAAPATMLNFNVPFEHNMAAFGRAHMAVDTDARVWHRTEKLLFDTL